MLAGRKSSSLVLPQVPAGYRPAALAGELQEGDWWFASVLPRVCRVKSPVHRLKCLRTLAPVAGYAPAVFALRGRLESANPLQGHYWQRRRDLHPLDIRFERPTARLLGARRHKVAPRLGLAPRSFRLTGERITLILPRNKKMVGHLGTAPSLSSSQAKRISFFLMPDGG